MPVANLQRRLAGFRFEAQPPVLPEVLPRMDIAVFVGFAAAGPPDLPVVVEDVNYFNDIFGEELALAWDAHRNETITAHLAAAVRSFFQNGGKRCWIIRVVGPAETDAFALPGLAAIDGNRLGTAWARARSAGSWFDGFECATAMTIDGIELAASPVADFSTLYARLRTANELSSGDLLRLTWEDPALQGVELYFSVSGASVQTESTPPLGRRRFAVAGQPLAWVQAVTPDEVAGAPCHIVWTRRPAGNGEEADEVRVQGVTKSPDSPPTEGLALVNVEVPGDFDPPAGALLEVTTAGELLWLVVTEVRPLDEQAPSPPDQHTRLIGRVFRRLPEAPMRVQLSLPIAQKVTFELEVRRGAELNLRLTELGFVPARARYWNALPTDAQVFESPDFTVAVREAEAEPYTGLWSEALEPRFPLAGRGGNSFIPLGMGTLAGPFMAAVHSDRTEGERDGWDARKAFNAALFLDEKLTDTGTQDLMNEADFLRYQSPNPRRLRGIHAALEVEEATLIVVPDAVHRGWKRMLPERGPAAAPSELLPHPCWGLTEDGAEPSAPAAATAPRWDKFLGCDLRVLRPPVLELSSVPDGVGTFTLNWSTNDSDAEFVLEEGVEPDFADAVVIYQGRDFQRRLYGRSPGQYFYRVRSVAGMETSDWSNGIAAWVRPPSRWLENSETEYRVGPLLDIHRALLRMSAARGDLLAVLTLPEHFRESEALTYLDTLRNRASDDPAVADQLTRPLGAGEAQVFSYGAVYHPWVLEGDTNQGLRRTPPDGMGAGVIARRSLARGAWIAPANESWRGVLGLSPVLDPERHLDLLLAQLNQVRQEPSGFMTLNADTLSGDEYQELRPINVRRLLILLRRAALRLGMTYVFEPNGEDLRRLVQRGFDSLLDQLFVRGAFAGATRATSYQVVTDDTINTPQSMDQGRFRVDIKVAPSLPLSFVTVRLVQMGERSFATEIL